MAIPINQGIGVQELCKFAGIVTQTAAVSVIRTGNLCRLRSRKDWGSIRRDEFARRVFLVFACLFLVAIYDWSREVHEWTRHRLCASASLQIAYRARFLENLTALGCTKALGWTKAKATGMSRK